MFYTNVNVVYTLRIHYMFYTTVNVIYTINTSYIIAMPHEKK